MKLKYLLFILLLFGCSNREPKPEKQPAPEVISVTSHDTVELVKAEKDSVKTDMESLTKPRPQKTEVKTSVLKLVSATEQIVNHGAAPGQTYNYNIRLSSESGEAFKIKSITSIADKKPVEFKSTLDNKAINISFGIFKPGETDRRGRPVENEVPSNDISKGVTIHYTLKEKPLTLSVKGFKRLTDIDTP